MTHEGIPITGPGSNTRRVGRRLPGVHIGTPESRIGIPMEAQVAEVIRQVETNNVPVDTDMTGHVPNIAAKTMQGVWGVFCMRCSYEASEYIHPCRLDPTDWPPAELYEAPPTADLDIV